MTKEEIHQAIDKLENLKRTSQFNEAKTFAYDLLENPAIQEDAESLANVYNILGVVYSLLSDYHKALEYNSKALHINEEIGNKGGIAHSLGNIGNVYCNLSDYPKALEYLSKAILIERELEDKRSIALNLGNIGLVYHRLSDYHKALEYCSKSLHICEEIGNKQGIATNLGNIGIDYWNLSDYPKALEYYSKALHINEEIGNKQGIAANLGNIGLVYHRLSDYPKALEYYSKALHINEEIGNKDGIATNLGNMGMVYSLLSDYPKAFEYLNRAHSLSIEIGLKFLKRDHLQQYSELYEKMGEIEKAFSYYKQYIALEKEINSEETKKNAQIFEQRRILEEDEKARQLKLARFQEQERIFHNILPISIADRLIEGEQTIAESFENVSIFFSDIINFTTLSSNIEPAELVKGLNTIFTAFDRIGTKYGLEKIKTIGDAYMAVCGVPEVFEDHQYRATQFAIEASEVLETLDLGKQFKSLQIRIGLHCGSVVAGIIGEKKFAYDVWGDAVNIASRMESNSEAGRINVSEAFAASIKEYPEFKLIPRGELNIKGKGIMNTFWLVKNESI